MQVIIKDDFDLEKIMNSGQVFRIQKSDNDSYCIVHQDKILYISKDGSNTYNVSCDQRTWNETWRDYFDLNRDYSKIRKDYAGNNNFVDVTMNFGQGLRILKQDPWEMLITFIISQRKSMKAIKSSIDKICLQFGVCLDDEIYKFPSPQNLCQASISEIQACGVGYRADYIKSAAESVATGALDLCSCAKKDDGELFYELCKVKGVGTKVANCIMLFGFGRVGRAPIDVWIERVIQDEFGGVNPFPEFGDVAGIIQQYFFFFKTQNK